MNQDQQFIALIGDERIPTSAKVIAKYIRAQGAVPFEFIPAPGQKVDAEQDERPAQIGTRSETHRPDGKRNNAKRADRQAKTDAPEATQHYIRQSGPQSLRQARGKG